MNGPTRVLPQGSSGALVDLSDILPTLVELAGGSLPADYPLDGVSFAPLLTGGGGERQRAWVFSCLGDRRFLRSARWLLDGDEHFWDCGERRDGKGYVNVTRSERAEVEAARRNFARVIEGLPPPPRRLVRAAWRRRRCELPRPITIPVKS